MGAEATFSPLTLPEKFVRSLNLAHLGRRYDAGVLFWVAFLGPGLSTLSSFLQTLFSFWRYGLFDTLTPQELSRFSFSWIPSSSVASAGLVVGYVSLAYVFYATRYIREKMLLAKSSLSTALAYKDSEFKAIFGRMSSTRVPAEIALLWAAVLGVLVPVLSYGTAALPNFAISSLIYSFPTGLIFVSLFWTYYAALRGIHDLGRQLDVVVPYSEDPFLGLKPIGNLALRIAGSFFGFLGILSLSDLIVLFAFGRDLPSPTSLSISASTLIFALVGLLMFFLPLSRFHTRMVGEKNNELSRYNEELSTALRGPPDNSIEHLVELTRIQLIEKRILEIQEWPFDVQVIRRLLALFFSVVSSIGISVIQSFIHV